MSVFISGTFVDMEPWRNTAIRAVNKSEQRAKDLADATYGPAKLKSYIDQELETSDFYLGIFGVRYGELMDNDPRAPSWTHYEFLYFFNMLERLQLSEHSVPMLVLIPKSGSEAHQQITDAAREVFAKAGVSDDLISQDFSAQHNFLRSIREGGVHLNHDVLISIETLQLKHDTAIRLVDRFRNEAELRYKICDYLQLRQIRLLRDELAKEQASNRGAPVATELPALSPSDISRLQQATPAPALCVLTQPSKNCTAGAVADALHQRNPFDCENLDKFVDYGLDSLDPKMSNDELVELYLQAIGSLVFLEIENESNYMNELAEHIVAYEEPVVVRIKLASIKGFNLAVISTKLWKPLQQAIVKACASQSRSLTAGQSPNCLLLIVSQERVVDGPAKNNNFQGFTSKTFKDFARPFLMFAASDPAPASQMPRTSAK